MPGRVAIDPFVSLQAEDFHSEAEFDGDKTPNSFYIQRSKRKKSKNRRHSDTIWTIVHEQENAPSSSKPKSKSKSSKHHHKSKKESSSPSKHNKSKESKKSSKSSKKNATSTPTDPNRRASFLDNPIFETELKNWTLPRVELWCRDPGCQINAQLWREYCQTHQAELTKLQVEELQQEQHQYLHHHNHHYQHQHQDQHPHEHQRQEYHQQHHHHQSRQTVPRSQRLSSITPAYCFDDCVNSSPVVPMVLCDKSGAGGSHECRHPFHHQEEEQYYQHHHNHHHQGHQHIHRQSSHGNMHANMSIGSSMNNLSAQDAAAAAAALSSGMGAYSPPHNTNNNSNKSYNNINHSHPPPPPPPPSSVIISVPSGASSSTNNSNSGKPTSTTVSHNSHHHQVSSTNAGSNGGGKGSMRDDFSGSTSSSSSTSSASGTDVSSGSTFVTGFDSSESRNSSVPHSLSKVPHPNLITESNHRTEPTSYSSHTHKMTTQSSDHHHHNHNHMMGYGDSTNSASGGYPSLPYIPNGYRKTGVCPSCNGLVPPPSNHHLVPVDPIISSGGHGGVGGDGPLQHKSDNTFWNFTKFQHPLQRDHSFHSVGGFTLNGQYNTQVKKRRVVKFCSSHKIALVVSTFSLMVTVGLIITLILMKKRGMMDTMDMMPT